jgi:tRNA pseudouridine38-40 synthase
MRAYKLTLEYDGSGYSGWQDQANARTVQGELKAAARDLFQTECDVQGSGRTDAGVHALGQVAHVKMRTAPRFIAAEVLRELNNRLPSSIAVVECTEVSPKFHARHDALSRTYFYQISTRKAALAKRYVWWIKQPLDLARMQRAAALIPGRHDFAAFCAPDPSKHSESTIVVVESAEVGQDGHMIIFRIEASHFLWKMVRRLTGALVRIGLGELTVEQFGGLLTGEPDPTLDIAAWTAPASGLFLESVRYAGPD